MDCKECQGDGWHEDDEALMRCTACDGTGSVTETCEGCNREVPRGACYWWSVTAMHQCDACHTQGQADIRARDRLEREGPECACCGYTAGGVLHAAQVERVKDPVCCMGL